MIEVIPSINVKSFAEAVERIAKVEPYVKWVHLDVTDGVFSKHETWRDPQDLPGLLSKSHFNSNGHYRSETSIVIEMHLMIAEPEKVIDRWLIKPVRRVIVHMEAMQDPGLIIQKCREAGIEIGFAINPETPWKKLKPWFGKADLIQTLNVHPGSSGQKAFWPETLPKIEHIRKSCPGCIIEVDGGVNEKTAKKAVEAGANILVAGHAIFSAQNIKKTIEELKNVERKN